MTTPKQPPTGFTCAICGKYHDGLPLDIAFDAPFYWTQIREAERPNRGELTADFCAIDDRDFFVRGLIPVPVVESDQFFMWGVWTSVSRKNYSRLIDLWHDPKIVDEPPYFGWLSNRLPGYPDTLNLKINLQSKNEKCEVAATHNAGAKRPPAWGSNNAMASALRVFKKSLLRSSILTLRHLSSAYRTSSYRVQLFRLPGYQAQLRLVVRIDAN